jgi:biotin operon repressor
MDPDKFQILLEFFKALADESRLRLIGLLAQGECSVEELASRVDLKEPTVSHHLQRLRNLGLVTLRQEGNSRLYSLCSDALQRLSKEMLALEMITAPEADSEARWDNKVLATFVQGDVLVSIPASRKKRQVVLHWLVERFSPGQTYTEAEVNRLIQPAHADSATLRRELVASGLLVRQEGCYLRPLAKPVEV